MPGNFFAFLLLYAILDPIRKEDPYREGAGVISEADNNIAYRKRERQVKKRMGMQDLRVYAREEGWVWQAEQVAARLGLAYEEKPDTISGGNLALAVGPAGLSLEGDGLQVTGDFSRMLPRIRPGNLPGELLLKAARFKGGVSGRRAVDATAGLGEDSFLLAAAGFEVEMYEYNPVIAALLKDALRRAAEIQGLLEVISRMHLREEDSIQALAHMAEQGISCDVVYLDPMFPARQKNSLVKKKLQMLEKLEMPCRAEKDLLDAAKRSSPKKIIIKRPAKGPFLARQKPDYSLQGKAVRFDVLLGGRETQ